MLTLFNGTAQPKAAVRESSQWSYVRRGLQINLSRVLNFWQIHRSSVQSEHLLIKTIQNLAVPMSLPLSAYARQCSARAPGLSMSLGFCSVYSSGRVFDGEFYGPGCHEIVLLDDDYFDADWVNTNWQKARPIRVLEHPKSDTSLLTPNGTPYSNESGLVVMSLNIAMLAVMYRAFTLAQTARSDSLSPYQFVASWVLPGMLVSHLDISLFNALRLACLDKLGLPTEQAKVLGKLPFRLVDYTPYIEHSMRFVADNLSKTPMPMYAQLQNWPAAVAKNQLEVMVLPDLYPVAQNAWALVSARLRAFELMLLLNPRTTIASDRDVVQQLIRRVAQLNVKALIREKLPATLADQKLEIIEKIESSIKR